MTAKQKEMLKDRMREFYNELEEMRKLITHAEKALNEVKPNTNLTKAIGKFVKDLPKFEYLRPQSDYFKATVRKVCSGELEPRKASNALTASCYEIMELLECFNRNELFTDVNHVPMEPVSEE